MKNIGMENAISELAKAWFGRARDGLHCVTCGSDQTKSEHFRNDISRREWEISQMCQNCQDSVFGVD